MFSSGEDHRNPCGAQRPGNSPASARVEALWQQVEAATRKGHGVATLRAAVEQELQQDQEVGLTVATQLFERAAQRQRLDLGQTLVQVLQATPCREAGAAVRFFWIGHRAQRTGDYLVAEQAYQMALILAPTESRMKARTLETLGRLYFERGRLGLAERLYQQAVRISRRAGDAEPLANHYRHLAELYRRQRRWTASSRASRQALALLPTTKAHPTVGRLWLNRGIMARIQGQWASAWSACRQAYLIFETLRDDLGRALALQQLGRTAYFQGDWEHARILTVEALRQLRARQADAEVRLGLRNLGEMELACGDLQRAEQHLQEGLTLCQQRDDLYLGAQILGVLGQVARARGQGDEAWAYFQASLKQKEAIGDEHGIGWTCVDLAELYRDQGQWREGLRRAEQGLHLLRSSHHRYRQVQALVALLRLRQVSDHPGKTARYFRQARALAKRWNYWDQQAWLALLEGDAYFRRGQMKRAGTKYREAVDAAGQYNASLLRKMQEEVTGRFAKVEQSKQGK